MTEPMETDARKEGQFLPIRERQRIHVLLDQNEYELAHSRDNGRPEKFPTQEILEARFEGFLGGTVYFRKFQEAIREIEKKYGEGKHPRERNHRGGYEMLKGEAIERYREILIMGRESGIISIDRRPDGAPQRTIERYMADPREVLIPYILEKLSKGGNIISVADGEANARKSTSMIWIALELSGKTYELDGDQIEIPKFNLRKNVHFTVESLMEALGDEPPRGTSFILDDWGQEANSKRHMELENMITSELAQTVRDHQFNLFMTSPKLENIDAQARNNIWEYFSNYTRDEKKTKNFSQGEFTFGKPVFDKQMRFEKMEYVTRENGQYKIEGVPAILELRTVVFPLLPEKLYLEYKKYKEESFTNRRFDRLELVKIKHNNKEAAVQESEYRKLKAELMVEHIRGKEEDQKIKRKAKAKRGMEIKSDREGGMKIKQIIEKYGISAKSISEYITFYETHRELVEESPDNPDQEENKEEN